MSSSATTNPQCTVILTLAHLLQQHSLSYDDEKNILLESSVKCGMKLANQGNSESANGEGNNDVAEGNAEGELHMVLTGSPRPTFAETNAWLLEGEPNGAPTTPRRKSRGDSIGGAIAPRERSGTADSTDIAGLRGSYSILDNAVDMTPNKNDDGEDEDAMSLDENNEKEVLQGYISSLTHSSVQGRNYAEHVNEFDDPHSENNLDQPDEPKPDAKMSIDVEQQEEKKIESPDKVNLNKGPMVGHAVVNAVNQTQGVGLRSSRAKLLQGTIDRPLWDQRRWTDGECLFSELVDKCKSESFYDLFERRKKSPDENVGVAGRNASAGGSVAGGADAAAGGGGGQPPAAAQANVGTAGLRVQKTTNLSAHLITVPAILINPNTIVADEEVPGLEEETVEEIARGILRCLKRKKSPPTSKVYLVLPPDQNVERDAARRQAVHSKLAAAWQKLERYNDMIGAPRLMADAEFVFVDVSF